MLIIWYLHLMRLNYIKVTLHYALMAIQLLQCTAVNECDVVITSSHKEI